MNIRKAPYPKIGMRFGILTVISDKEIKDKGIYFWRCKCDCGNEIIVWNHNLLNGNTKACRCVTKKNITARCTTHGMTHTRPWNIWNDMKRRCNDPRRNDYARYGGRGTKICKCWEKFENFWKDMRESYIQHVATFGEKETTIDRIDSYGNYEYNNCRWATYKEQANNKRK